MFLFDSIPYALYSFFSADAFVILYVRNTLPHFWISCLSDVFSWSYGKKPTCCLSFAHQCTDVPIFNIGSKITNRFCMLQVLSDIPLLILNKRYWLINSFEHSGMENLPPCPAFSWVIKYCYILLPIVISVRIFYFQV